MNGFSISQYRNANKLTLVQCDEGVPSKDIFTGYYVGGIDYNFQLRTGEFNNFIEDIANKVLTNPFMKSSLRGMPSNFALSAMDTPLKPYIEGVSPLQHQFDCYLPLLSPDSTDVSDPYYTNIVKPIEDLLHVFLPGRKELNEVANKVAGTNVASVDAFVKGLIEKFFSFSNTQPGASGKSSTGARIKSGFQTFWNIAQEMAKEWWADFASEAYFLTEPLQFQTGKYLMLRLGEGNRIQDNPIYITGLNVGLGPNIYTDGERTYPAFAKVKFDCIRRYKPTNQFKLDSFAQMPMHLDNE